MSFRVTLYRITDEPNRINKNLTYAQNLDGTLKEGTSMINPTIIIERGNSDTTLIVKNYAYIAQFGNRYYFITDRKMITNNLMELTLKVDVLMTYKSTILGTPMIIDRAEVSYNNYIHDSAKVKYSYPMVLTKKFPYGLDNLNYFLTTAGR